jgi:hypothetical protein
MSLDQKDMKKNTLILCLLVTSLGFAQTLIENFEGPVFPVLSVANGASLATPSAILADPAGIKDDVLAIISNSAGQPWQQTELLLQNGNLDLTGTDKRVSVDWYSIPPFSGFIRVDNRISGTVLAGTAEAAHPGGGWVTLVFDFSTQAQPSQTGTEAPNGVYRDMYFFNHWEYGAGDFFNPFTGTTTYIDNIVKGVAPPVGSVNWTGITSDWHTDSNWGSGLEPTTGDNVNIPFSTNAPTATTLVDVSSITIQSGASFIANAAVTGDVTYNRDLSTSNWYYVSSPVTAANVDAFVLASGLEAQGTLKALCAFDTAINNWVCYEDGTNFEDTFTDGKGYIVNLAAPTGTIAFTGTMNLSDELIPLDTTGSGYNLLGNPFTSYVNTGTMLSTSTTALETETIWVFDVSTNSYETKVTADNFQLAPAQGFFIQSNGIPGNVAINEAFQSHQNPDTFLRTAERAEVYLTLSDGSTVKNTRIYYIDGTTTGFDNGYDGPMFRAFADPFSIYTHLVAGGFGTDMGVQSVPNDDYENLVVPVGVTATSGTEITIAANAVNLPEGIDLYLEDRDNDTFTLLDANSDFTFTPANALNGVGRFYLHTSNSVLGLNDNTLAYDLQIYTTDTSKELVIKGQLSGVTNADIFDVQGRLVLSKELQQNSNSNTLDISSLNSGVYVVKVNNASQSLTQKVFIK